MELGALECTSKPISMLLKSKNNIIFKDTTKEFDGLHKFSMAI